MNKNPFIPQPSFPIQQPPLPPGPPPPQPSAQPDYSAYWSAHQQPVAQPAFNPQWSGANPQWPGVQPAQPAAPAKAPADQTALYANYGYGGQQNAHWQQQQHQHHPPQQQQHHYAQPPAPAVPTGPHQPYNPYQPQGTAPAPYQQAYVPQGLAPPQAPAQQPFRPPQPQVTQQPFYQQHQHQQQQQQRPPPHVQHSSPHQLPPAKRQRFDNSHQSTPVQPRFQAPPPPMAQQNIPLGPNRPHGMPNPPPQASQMQSQANFSGGMGRGGMGGARGGANMNRGTRGGHAGGNRGMALGRGRGGNMHGGASRGGAGQSSGSMRGHQSRDRGNFSNFNRRGGGSFPSGPHHHQNNASFRGHGGRSGGGQIHGGYSGRGGRADGFHQNRVPANAISASASGSIGKREENRRTLTDFKIIGLEIESLNWQWGLIPHNSESDEKKDDGENAKVEEEDAVKEELVDTQTDLAVSAEASSAGESSGDSKAVAKDSSHSHSASNGASAARVRIYFHTPPSADDARPILPTPSFSDLRKGKRKKLDDDDGDADEEIRAPPPPPVPDRSESADGDPSLVSTAVEQDTGVGRGSVAPSVAETVSDADWLMAAIAEGEADGETDIYEQTQVELDMEVHDHDGEFDADETMAESEILQDELVMTQTQTDVASRVDVEESASVEIENVDPLAGSASPVTPLTGEPDPVPADETVTQTDQMEAVDSDTKEETETLVEVLPAKEPSPELIISSVVSSVESGEDGETKAVEPEAPVAKDANGVSEKPMDVEHLPEPPASPASNAAFSGTTSTISTTNLDLPAKPTTSGIKVPSANRVSISYAAGTRRLLIDAEIVEKMIVFRAEGRIELDMMVERADGGFKGILIETLNNETKAYSPLQVLSEASESDVDLPPFWKLESPTKAVFSIYLDKERPLSEPKWVKTGDVHDWLKDMFGGRFWVAGEAVGWEKKIDVRYPDPAPTIQTVLAGWSGNSPVGMPSERARFVKTHMTYADNVLEILLRLVRGERATPFSQNASAISAPSITGPLLAALDPSSPHSAQQTHVSLAVVAIVRLASQFAEQALGEGKGKEQVDDRVGEIIRCLPSHLLYKSLDGMFKEWRAEKKGGR
ncbi:hypothetical protein M0805_005416 [Coniferiporia weirii]|nr:hypothetical protein M0805_005416 [Coniferiporia weirii]